MFVKIAEETTAIVGTFLKEGETKKQPTISQVVPAFLRHGQFELSFSPQTVFKYGECLNMVIRDIGDVPVHLLTLDHITELKQKVVMRGAGEARLASMIFALKSMLRYCRENLEIPVLPYQKIKAPKRRRRDVIFLTNEEIQQFIENIKIENKWNGRVRGKCLRMDGLRFRVLVEVLLGTGMRISEALSLNRDSVDFEKGEAKIIGKGSKERVVFFNERAMVWVKTLLDNRTDTEPALFVNQKHNRLTRCDVDRVFRLYAKKSGIGKKITPHILRHTMATNLLFNGCPISHVKEILGHDRLETTCRYYLGLDKRKAKEAHGKFLNY